MAPRITARIDGACTPVNPGGIATYGAVVYRDGKKIHEMCGVAAEGELASNNVGEYAALVALLEWLLSAGMTSDVTIEADSSLVVNQMNGAWKCNDGLCSGKRDEAFDLASKFTGITFRWIPREKNGEADALTRRAYIERAK